MTKISDCVNSGCDMGIVDWAEYPNATGPALTVGQCSTCGTYQLECECGQLLALDVGVTTCHNCSMNYEADRELSEFSRVS
jgi:hypothetical protein